MSGGSWDAMLRDEEQRADAAARISSQAGLAALRFRIGGPVPTDTGKRVTEPGQGE